MLDININYINVEAKVSKMQKYIDASVLIKIEEYYKVLEDFLNDMEGSFTNELRIALVKEKAIVLEYIRCLKEIYQLVGEATEGFREVDEQSTNRF